MTRRLWLPGRRANQDHRDIWMATRPTRCWVLDALPASGGGYLPDIAAGQVMRRWATSEIQHVNITGSPTGGTFTLTFSGQTTGPITYSTTTGTLSANIDAALEALSNIGAGGVLLGSGAITGGMSSNVTFSGALAGADQPLMTIDVSGLTGGTPVGSVLSGTDGGRVYPGASAHGREWGRLGGTYLLTPSAVPDPVTSLTVGCLYIPADYGGSRFIAGPQNFPRLFASEASGVQSWRLIFSSSQYMSFAVLTSAGTVVATTTVNVLGAAWTLRPESRRLVIGSFDGTTIRLRQIADDGGWQDASSTSVTGTWNKSGSILNLSQQPGGLQLYGGAAIWNDRILSDSEMRALAARLFA